MIKIISDIVQRLPRLSGGISLSNATNELNKLIESEKNEELSEDDLKTGIKKIKEILLLISQPTMGRNQIKLDIISKIDKFLKNDEPIEMLITKEHLEEFPELVDVGYVEGDIVVDDINSEGVGMTELEITQEHLDDNPELIEEGVKVGDIVEIEDFEELEEESIEVEITQEHLDDNTELIEEGVEVGDVVEVQDIEISEEEPVAKILGKKKNVTKTFIKKNKEISDEYKLEVGHSIFVDEDEENILYISLGDDTPIVYLDEPLKYNK